MVKYLPVVDTPPSSGAFVEHDDIEITEEEIRKGNLLGEAIDPYNDDDNGLEMLEEMEEDVDVDTDVDTNTEDDDSE